jgi:hypothetical protein
MIRSGVTLEKVNLARIRKLEENKTSPGCSVYYSVMLWGGFKRLPKTIPLIELRGFFHRLVTSFND